MLSAHERHQVLRYFCSPHRAQTALHPVIAQMEHAAGIAPADSEDIKLDKLVRLLALSSRPSAEDIDLFADLLSIHQRRSLLRRSRSARSDARSCCWSTSSPNWQDWLRARRC